MQAISITKIHDFNRKSVGPGLLQELSLPFDKFTTILIVIFKMESIYDNLRPQLSDKLSNDANFCVKLRRLQRGLKERAILITRVIQQYKTFIETLSDDTDAKESSQNEDRFDRRVLLNLRLSELYAQLAAARNLQSFILHQIDCSNQKIKQLHVQILNLQNQHAKLPIIKHSKSSEMIDSPERIRCFSSIICPLLSTTRTFSSHLSLQFARYWYFSHFKNENDSMQLTEQIKSTDYSSTCAQALLIAILVDIYSKYLRNRHCSNSCILRRRSFIENGSINVQKLLTFTVTEMCPYLSEVGWRQLMLSDCGLDIFFETLCEDFLKRKSVGWDLDINQLLETLCERQHKQLQDWHYIY
ncbi:hypothetical protein GJ496_001885 [Pomphorhynchus laevis]|nr:hypothetical protein GJ496_001885 [Pomphorhynchus laevis]